MLEIACIRVLHKLEVDAGFWCACIASFHNQVILLFLLLGRLTQGEAKCGERSAFRRPGDGLWSRLLGLSFDFLRKDCGSRIFHLSILLDLVEILLLYQVEVGLTPSFTAMLQPFHLRLLLPRTVGSTKSLRGTMLLLLSAS